MEDAKYSFHNSAWGHLLQIFSLNTPILNRETPHNKIKGWARSGGSFEILWRAADNWVRRNHSDSRRCCPRGIFSCPFLSVKHQGKQIEKETDPKVSSLQEEEGSQGKEGVGKLRTGGEGGAEDESFCLGSRLNWVTIEVGVMLHPGT